MQISTDDPTTPDVLALLEAHVVAMRAISPPGSVHALDPSALVSPAITFWTAREQNTLLACGALKRLDEHQGELKSMRVIDACQRRGIACTLLAHIADHARRAGYRRLSLETGSTNHFLPARRLYETAGFAVCDPFADYLRDPHSTFMTLELDATHNFRSDCQASSDVRER